MPQPRDRRHLIVPTPTKRTAFTPPPRKIEPQPIPAPADRRLHGQALKSALQGALVDARKRRAEAGIAIQGAKPGMYVQYDSQPGVPLNLTSLERQRSGMYLAAVNESEVETTEGPKLVQHAIVFVPERAVEQIAGRLDEYSAAPAEGTNARHQDAFDRVSTVHLAALRSLWTDADAAFPDADTEAWWEVWLIKTDGREAARFSAFAEQTGLTTGRRRLEFDDRVVVLAYGTARQLSVSLDVLADIGEVRRAREAASFFDALPPDEQAAWVEDVARRVEGATGDAPAVCLLDTGVNRGHPLLMGALAETDLHSVDPAWGVHDHDQDGGHGTAMAGLALYGDLRTWLGDRRPIVLRHRLESVKLLPPPGFAPNQPELYGAVTAEATSRVEVAAARRRRCFAMAVTAPDRRDRGVPTSWSAAIDALAAGRSFDATTEGLVYLDDVAQRRLIIVAGGNVDPGHEAGDYLGKCDAETIHDPGQAWNALTVGAMTNLVDVDDVDGSRAGYVAHAPRGELSPFSTTSVGFDDEWPGKPDVVFEGGNTAIAPGDHVDFPVPGLSLLTTHHRPAERSFSLMFATSAATAQVARIAAAISADYPELWPESVRGLIVHAAEWTAAMKRRFDDAPGKRARAKLLRRYGYGEPSLQRSLRSGRDALTLIAQGTIRPYADGKMREICFHELPWPEAALEALGGAIVRLRVTLSYFVEPNPARRGWTKRYRYPSHGLRFDVIGPTEDLASFEKRLNKQALDDGERAPAADAQATEWYLGKQARDKGSLHSDIWSGTARDLASRKHIAVFPVGGWWKEHATRDRSEGGARYALVVSIETDDVAADVWTPVATEIGVPITIEGA